MNWHSRCCPGPAGADLAADGQAAGGVDGHVPLRLPGRPHDGGGPRDHAGLRLCPSRQRASGRPPPDTAGQTHQAGAVRAPGGGHGGGVRD